MLFITVALALAATQVQAYHEENCTIDICFLVDESGSVTLPNWNAFVIPFLIGLTNGLIGTGARGGIVTFSTDADCDLPGLNSMADVAGAVPGLSWDNGETYLALGLEKCRTSVFGDPPQQDRERLVILLTDGQPNDPSPTALPDAITAITTAPYFADIIPVGVGPATLIPFLSSISTLTVPPTFFLAPNFPALVALVEGVVDKVKEDCEHEPECPECDGSFIKDHKKGPGYNYGSWPPKIFGWGP